MRIIKQHPNAHFFVPLRNKQWFTDSGIDNITELDWWEERDIRLSPTQEKAVEITGNGSADSNPPQSSTQDIEAHISCLPCQHTSARTMFDKGHTLWASWSIESGGKKVWFGG